MQFDFLFTSNGNDAYILEIESMGGFISYRVVEKEFKIQEGDIAKWYCNNKK